ncbi:MAG: hypothetical protein ACUVTD_08810 [Nitrososphaerales archaeon]
MSKPIIITKARDSEGKPCWRCPFDKTLYLLTDNFIKHMSLLHNVDVSDLIEEPEELLRCECDSYFVCKSDLEDHKKVCGRKCDCPRHIRQIPMAEWTIKDFFLKLGIKLK